MNKLTLANLRAKPSVRLLPEIPRSLESVNRSLRAYFNDCLKGKKQWPLFVFGSVGTGKTLGALTLCDYAPTAAYMTAEDAADGVVDHSLDSTWIASKSLFVVDEIGERGNVGDLHYKALKRILDARDRPGVASVYISNVPPDEIRDLYDDRVLSRLCRGTNLELVGEDRRLAKR